MILGRTVLLGVTMSAALAMSLPPTEASAGWHERDAFGRLACWYAGGNPSYTPGPAPYFGYGGPSCEERRVVHTRHHHRARPLRARG